LAFGGLIEQTEPGFGIEGGESFAGRNYANDVACRNPVDLVTGPNGISVGNFLGKRDLEF
jgi:hypothetical protein